MYDDNVQYMQILLDSRKSSSCYINMNIFQAFFRDVLILN